MLQLFDNKLSNSSPALQIYSYTDDTAMMKSVAESLISCKEFNGKDLATRFTQEYVAHRKRGYGANVIDIFHAWNESGLQDEPHVWEPAKRQFNGSGSLGNGAAMRIHPVACYGYHMSHESLIQLAKNCSLLTHTHPYGYNGAILQTLAVRRALEHFGNASSGDTKFSSSDFLDDLIQKMRIIEETSPEPQVDPERKLSVLKKHKAASDVPSKTPFTDKLVKMQKLMTDKTQGTSDLSPEEVAVMFGNNVSALGSVPTAIYSFLRAHDPLKDYETDDIFLRTLYFAISVGGDTDTIASMACSITGALYGEACIKSILKRHCEFSDDVLKIADQIFDSISTVD